MHPQNVKFDRIIVVECRRRRRPFEMIPRNEKVNKNIFHRRIFLRKFSTAIEDANREKKLFRSRKVAQRRMKMEKLQLRKSIFLFLHRNCFLQAPQASLQVLFHELFINFLLLPLPLRLHVRCNRVGGIETPTNLHICYRVKKVAV